MTFFEIRLYVEKQIGNYFQRTGKIPTVIKMGPGYYETFYQYALEKSGKDEIRGITMGDIPICPIKDNFIEIV